MTKTKKLATSGTLIGIQKKVNDFWFSSMYFVDPVTLEIKHPWKSEIPKSYRVRRSKRKGLDVYVFERVLD